MRLTHGENLHARARWALSQWVELCRPIPVLVVEGCRQMLAVVRVHAVIEADNVGIDSVGGDVVVWPRSAPIDLVRFVENEERVREGR